MEKKKKKITILKKDAVIQHVVKSVAKLSLLFSVSFGFNAILLLDDSVVIKVKMLETSMGNLPG